MLIPFGVFSAAGAGGGAAAGSYELISTAYGTGSSSVITFSSIPSTYKHLQIRYAARTTGTGTSGDSITVVLNGDSASNYSRHYLQGDGSSMSSANGSDTIFNYPHSLGQTATTNMFAAGIIDILDYVSTSKNKTMRSMTSDHFQIRLASSVWLNTSAINSISLTSSGSHVAAARFSLYGIKG